MLDVIQPEEVFFAISGSFDTLNKKECVDILDSYKRVLFCDISGDEYVPSFSRSAMDGYALISKDTSGATDSFPSILDVKKRIQMGEDCDISVESGECVYVPTGGALPENADGVVMVEYCEEYGDGTVGIKKAVSPGQNVVKKGDDVYPGKLLLKKGSRITSADIGTLAAIGKIQVPVVKKPVVGIISTGDEIVERSVSPEKGFVRDINSATAHVIVKDEGAVPLFYGIIKDDETLIRNTLKKAVNECDVVLLSGGSSVGIKDKTEAILKETGDVIFHGIAIKPGKPTLMAKVSGKPVVGLPGNPVASLFITKIFVSFLIRYLLGESITTHYTPAVLSETVSSNHGREEVMGVLLYKEGQKLMAKPVRTKSASICTLAGGSGFFRIDRNCEGMQKGEIIKVYQF